MQNAEEVTITMTREQFHAINESVESGEFATTNEAICDAVRVWQLQRMEDAERNETIRELVRHSTEGSWLASTTSQADKTLPDLSEPVVLSSR